MPPYIPEKPPLPWTVEELEARIPGWGVDRNPKDRPSVPRERLVDPKEIGAHWEFPERQPEKWPRERSVEHKFLTPVFGTAQPPRGISGRIRRFAYKRYSEGRAAHWTLLLFADRVDALEHHLTSFLEMRPDNPIADSGLLSELTHNGLAARRGRNRADARHHLLDPVIITGPWLAAGGYAVKGLKRLGKVMAGNGERQARDAQWRRRP